MTRTQHQCANPQCGSYQTWTQLDRHRVKYDWVGIVICTVFWFTIPLALWMLVRRYTAAPGPHLMHCKVCNFEWDECDT
jgi:hypothetical protein